MFIRKIVFLLFSLSGSYAAGAMIWALCPSFILWLICFEDVFSYTAKKSRFLSS